MKPLVSILMPVYNCEPFIQDSITSILNQTYPFIELIIIDDASTDNTIAFIEDLNDPRIILKHNAVHSGISESLNQGLEICKGKYIARMDGDDISLPTRLERQVEFMENHPEVTVLGTWYKELESEKIKIYPSKDKDIKTAMLEYCALAHPTVMFRKDFIIQEKINYKKDLEPAEDYDLWRRITGKVNFANLPEVLLEYRVHDNSVTRKNERLQKLNSDKCKAGILAYYFSENKYQESLASLVYSPENLNGYPELINLINWLNELQSINLKTSLFEKDPFKTFVYKKKADIILTYFKRGPIYSPKSLVNFFSSDPVIKNCLTLAQKIKFIIKCLIFFKPNTSEFI